MPELIEDEEIDNLSLTKTKDVPVVNKSRHYVDDDQITAILSDWKRQFDYNKANGLERPKLPEAVGAAIVDMAEQTGHRHNFQGYSYLDEMKSDAILHCMKYIHNFNPEKKSDKKGKVSAFGYINMIIWRCFTHRIEEEHEQQYLKYKSFELMGGMEAFQDEDMSEISGGGGDEGGGMSVGVLGADFIAKAREYEQKHQLNKAKKEKKVVFDNFMFELAPEVEDDMEIEFE